jgi:NTE family protein
VQARLYATQWPSTLHVAATDADTGVLTAFDHTCGHPLADVVSASGAVPGISPMVRFGGRTWIGGGMVSAANARLANGYERVLVIAPVPKGHAGIPSAHQDVEVMRATAKVELITPDPQSVHAIGPNPYDLRPGLVGLPKESWDGAGADGRGLLCRRDRAGILSRGAEFEIGAKRNSAVWQAASAVAEDAGVAAIGSAFLVGIVVSLAANIAAVPDLGWHQVLVAGWLPVALLCLPSSSSHLGPPGSPTRRPKPGNPRRSREPGTGQVVAGSNPVVPTVRVFSQLRRCENPRSEGCRDLSVLLDSGARFVEQAGRDLALRPAGIPVTSML